MLERESWDRERLFLASAVSPLLLLPPPPPPHTLLSPKESKWGNDSWFMILFLPNQPWSLCLGDSLTVDKITTHHRSCHISLCLKGDWHKGQVEPFSEKAEFLAMGGVGTAVLYTYSSQDNWLTKKQWYINPMIESLSDFHASQTRPQPKHQWFQRRQTTGTDRKKTST